MRRKVLIALLALGTVGGYASGFAALRWRHQHQRQAFEQHVAQVCTHAAQSQEAAAAPERALPASYGGPAVIVQVSPPAANAAPAALPAVIAPVAR